MKDKKPGAFATLALYVFIPFALYVACFYVSVDVIMAIGKAIVGM